jgi:hypothetical protein
MSTSTIRIKRNVEKEYFFSPDKSQCYLQDSAELTSKSSNRSNTDFIVRFDCNTILIKIDTQNTQVVIDNYYPLSTPLHFHAVAHQNDEVSGYTVFVIFDDHILRIRLENSEFVECSTSSFTISSELLQSIRQKSFSAINDGILRACFVVNKDSFYQFESYNLLLGNIGDRIFDKDNGFLFRLPVNIANIQINGERLEWMMKSKGKRMKFSISLFDGKDDSNSVPLYLFAQNGYYEDPRTRKIVKSCEGFHISTSDEIKEFEELGFEIVETIYVHLLDKNTGHLIQKLLNLNRYTGWCFPDSEAEFESDSDSDSDSD